MNSGKDAGGVSVKDGTFTLYSGEISYNKTSVPGGSGGGEEHRLGRGPDLAHALEAERAPDYRKRCILLAACRTPHAAIVPSERKGVALRVWIAPQQVGKVRLEFL